MNRYLVDTNILYGITLDKERCEENHIKKLLVENNGIITYATLFEIFNFLKLANRILII